MIELDEAKKAEIIRKAAGEASVTYGLHAADAAERAIDAVLSHLNTPEAPDRDPYVATAAEMMALAVKVGGWKTREAVDVYADYLRKRDEERDSEMLCRFLKVIDRCIVPTAPLNTELRCEFRKEFHS